MPSPPNPALVVVGDADHRASRVGAACYNLQEVGMKKRRGRKAFGTKEWEDGVYRHVSSHGQVEGAILEEYQQLANDEDISPAFRYLARMILDDEARHHRIFDDLATTLGIHRDHRRAEPPIPSLTGFHADRHRITGATNHLLRIEREDLRELEELARELKELRNVTLWGLLIELMIDDTKKHIKILEFVRDRAQDQPD